MRRIITIHAALLVIIFAFASCNKSRKQIVGKWKTDTGSNDVAWEFFDNGTLSHEGAPGRYTLGDNQRIKIQTSSATFVYQLELEGDRMIWKNSDGSKMELTKIR